MLDKITGQRIVCPWWLCFTFDNPLRHFIHNPQVILKSYVHPGDNVIDIGAGMGYFSIPLAKLVGVSGHVTAIDIQKEMLKVLSDRAKRAGVMEIITPHLAISGSLGNHAPADFILAFWMVHETKDQQKFLSEVCNLLKPDGLFLFVEPIIHVPKNFFINSLNIAQQLGFEIVEYPKIRLSHSALLRIKYNKR